MGARGVSGVSQILACVLTEKFKSIETLTVLVKSVLV